MVIELKGVEWVRDGSRILRNINWQVQQGEHWAVLGLNGSGKTSLLNMINGYIYPSQGRVKVLGNTFGQCDLRDVRKSIGWVSSALQEQLYVCETVEEIVLSGIYGTVGLYRLPDADAVDLSIQVLEEMQCGHLAKRTYKTLSQGEKQKVIIARALAARPALLILDEPCSGLDVFAREQLLAAVSRLASRPAAPTLIYVSHHIEEILPVFSHTLLLRHGEVYDSGFSGQMLTEDTLSAFFAHPVAVERRLDRVWLKLK